MHCLEQHTLLICMIVLFSFALSKAQAITADINSTKLNKTSSIAASKSHVPASPSNTGSGSLCSCYCPSYSSSSSSSRSCFSGDSFVTLTNGQSKPIGHLQSGDQLLTADGSNIIPTQMMLMLDQDRSSLTLFYTFITGSGHNISLTPLHLLPLVRSDDTLIYVAAKQVRVGDVLRVVVNNQMMNSPVTDVKVNLKTGIFAPLTTSGTVFVNGVMASCYANVHSHEKAHFYMGVLRWYDKIARSLSFDVPFGEQKMDGMHVIPRVMYLFGQWFRPSTLLSV